MRSNYKKLGFYIRQIDVRNENNVITFLRGVSSVHKALMKSKANTIGTNMSKYKVVEQNQFAFNPNTARMGDKIPIALNEGETCIVSQIYPVFEIIDKNILNPEYLMMWFKRPEFDRYARFKSHGSAREIFDWGEMCEVMLPIPSIEIQQEIVDEYHTITKHLNLNEKLNQKLEESAQALYKHWFLDFEFPTSAAYAASVGKPEIEGKPYKSSGGAMVYNEELDGEIPEGWDDCTLNEIVHYSKNRVKISALDISNYISTENMLADRKGVVEASNLPTSNTVTEFRVGDVLISNIRPYFKKIWRPTFNGGCSNDILCFVANNKDEETYLYYILEQDIFFDYIMAGSKGTKMPRGDKEWIMNYMITKPPIELINSLTNCVSPILKKIRTNISQNKVLEKTQSLLLSKMATVGSEEEIVT